MEKELAKSGYLVAIGLILIWMFAAIAFVVAGFFEYGDELGVFGDAFGSLNALFSALALIGVIATVFMQLYELKEARLDRKRQLDTQKEMSSQAFFSAVSTSTATWVDLMQRRFLTQNEVYHSERLTLAVEEYSRACLLDRLLTAHLASIETGVPLDLKHAAATDEDVAYKVNCAKKLLKIADTIEFEAQGLTLCRPSNFAELGKKANAAKAVIENCLLEIRKERELVTSKRKPIWVHAEIALMRVEWPITPEEQNASTVSHLKTDICHVLEELACRFFELSSSCVGIVIKDSRHG